MSKSMYALPAFAGQLTADDRHRMGAISWKALRRGISHTDFDIDEIINSIDRTMFPRLLNLQCESTPLPCGFVKFFPKQLGIFNQFLHTYYSIISTLEYKFLFKYLQLWQSYTILSATT